MRQHLQVSQAPDQNGFVTLFEDNGQRYVFSYNDNAGNSRTTVEVRNLDRNLFLRGWYVLPYSGATPAEARVARAKLTPAQFVVPILAPGQVCRRDRDLTVIPASDDCAFDARFGYPCAR